MQGPVSLTLLAWIRTIGSLTILGLPLLISSPIFKPIRRIISPYFEDFITLRSTVDPEPASASQKKQSQGYQLEVWRQIVLAGLAVIELAAWMAVVGSEILEAKNHQDGVMTVVLAAGMVLVWVRRSHKNELEDHHSTWVSLDVSRPPADPPPAIDPSVARHHSLPSSLDAVDRQHLPRGVRPRFDGAAPCMG